MKNILIEEYNSIELLNIPIKEPQNTFNYNFVDGPFLEILGPLNQEYKVVFSNFKTGRILHEATITNNMWTKANIKYCLKWKIEVFIFSTGEKVFEHIFNPEGKRVYIHMDSKAIGDTLAWFPYVEEFRKENNCKVICSTFHNEWFQSDYPEIEFTHPGGQVFDLYAMFAIGWFYEGKNVITEKIPIDFKKYPLQKSASEILNLKYKEIKPKISFKDLGNPLNKPYVVIAPHASAHAKYWNYPGGWQEIINFLYNNGYEVMMITQESASDEWHQSKLGGSSFYNFIDETGDKSLEIRMNQIKHASAFIGLGSGLSWISWALDTPTILISGFSYPYTEFQDCERIFPKDSTICRGCFNREWLDPGDWEWCPDQKGTPRQFECTKSINPEQVISSIKKVLHI